MLDDEMLWRVAVDRRRVTVEGLFFTDRGMVALTLGDTWDGRPRSSNAY